MCHFYLYISITFYTVDCTFYRRGLKFPGFPEISEKVGKFSGKKIPGEISGKKFPGISEFPKIGENSGKNSPKFTVFYKTRSVQQCTR